MGGAKHSSFARKNGEIVASRGQIDSEKYLASTSNSLTRKLSQSISESLSKPCTHAMNEIAVLQESIYLNFSVAPFLYSTFLTTLILRYSISICMNKTPICRKMFALVSFFLKNAVSHFQEITLTSQEGHEN